MTTEQMANHEADNFWRIAPSTLWEGEGFDEFKASLPDFDDDEEFKMLFLIRLRANIKESYSEHLTTCTAKDFPERCHENQFYERCIRYLEQLIRKLNPDLASQSVNEELIIQNFFELSNYPQVSKLLKDALDKYREGKYDRNVLDDLRLALEIFLKEKLSNSKPLEKQIEEVGGFLKAKGTDEQIRQAFTTLLTSYAKYQNENVKHNATPKKDEIELMINLTSTFIRFVASK